MKGKPLHALLFGATGLVGGQLLDALLDADGIGKVTAVTRRPLSRSHARLVNPVGDPSEARLAAGIDAADVAFCCLGTTIGQAGSKEAFRAVDHDLVLSVAGLSRQKGVRHFLLVSAMGASASSPVFYNRVKGETERDLADVGFPLLTILQPSLLLGERGGPARTGEAIAIRLSPVFSPLMIGPLADYTPVKAVDVAAALCARALAGNAADQGAVERLRWRAIMQLAGKA